MKWFAILAVTAVAACGVDGAPERPVTPAPKTAPQANVSISGHATMGVATEL
ncbi:argininosuccinate lyase [uncultured Paracoccus sp.]|uniref:argininosuccinate lyase n=1 Tax=uncultured Paracoccus sp. TaxID=189685 RepID=UPI0025FE4F91|nr:argininosuccinate lyase [uncultured Paracoccus sp.]